MSDQARQEAIAEADLVGRGGPAGSGTQGFTWPKIVLAAALLIAVTAAAYLLVRPASYLGDARWGRDYSTITLVGTGTTLKVDDATQIIGRGGDDLSLDLMRSPLFPPQTSVFKAFVVYKVGRAWSIEEQ